MSASHLRPSIRVETLAPQLIRRPEREKKRRVNKKMRILKLELSLEMINERYLWEMEFGSVWERRVRRGREGGREKTWFGLVSEGKE